MDPKEHEGHLTMRPMVAEDIPSAVRPQAAWGTPVLVGLVVVGCLALWVLKGSRRTSSHSQDELPFKISDASSQTGSASLPALPPMVPQAAFPRAHTDSLQEVRRNSPVLIFNATSANAGTVAPLGDAASGPPMPPGFHPSHSASAHSSSVGDREFVIAEGKLLDAVLETAINTDHPGLLRALVSDDIYGDTGRTVLLPRGSRLIGQYDSGVAQGQNRVFVIWQRVIRPDGIDINLDSGGTDPLGQAGLEGKVNAHFWTMFGAATLLSMIGASASTLGVGPQDANNSLSTYRSSVSQGFNEAANNVLGVFVRIKPTITVRQGTAVKVLVARDLYFDPSAVSAQRVQVVP